MTTRLEALCQQRGAKLTRPCRRVLAVIAAATDHPSAQEIHRRATLGERIALGTVYRILNRLTDAGVLTRHMFGDDKARYELASRRHHHLIDRRTGQIVEIDDRTLADSVSRAAARLGYRLVDFKLEVTAERKLLAGRETKA
jgi:Fur family ferric uptake transcriptional regulator